MSTFLKKLGSYSGQQGTNGVLTKDQIKLGLAEQAAKGEGKGLWYNETPGDKYIGLDNFGNTCYANSILQALYSLESFREHILTATGSSSRSTASVSPSSSSTPPGTSTAASVATTYATSTPISAGTLSAAAAAAPAETTLLSTLHALYAMMAGAARPVGSIAPENFIAQLKRDNGFFNSSLHQDAHEFLNFLLNNIADFEALRASASLEGIQPGSLDLQAPDLHPPGKSWIHDLFEGALTNETRCLTCETTTSREESFFDLSLDVEENRSIAACLRRFSESELLSAKNKFLCDTCGGLQEAEKRMKILRLPTILALHLKRFNADNGQHYKLGGRVAFPFEMRVETAAGAPGAERIYSLQAIVVHIGLALNHGHYIAAVRSGRRWIVFDDACVYPIAESEICNFFGDRPGYGCGYVLFYESATPGRPPSPGSASVRTEATGIPVSVAVSADSAPTVSTSAGSNPTVSTAATTAAVSAVGAVGAAAASVMTSMASAVTGLKGEGKRDDAAPGSVSTADGASGQSAAAATTSTASVHNASDAWLKSGSDFNEPGPDAYASYEVLAEDPSSGESSVRLSGSDSRLAGSGAVSPHLLSPRGSLLETSFGRASEAPGSEAQARGGDVAELTPSSVRPPPPPVPTTNPGGVRSGRSSATMAGSSNSEPAVDGRVPEVLPRWTRAGREVHESQRLATVPKADSKAAASGLSGKRPTTASSVSRSVSGIFRRPDKATRAEEKRLREEARREKEELKSKKAETRTRRMSLRISS